MTAPTPSPVTDEITPVRIQRKRIKVRDAARNKAWRSSANRPKAKCHPEKNHRARGMCDACYDRWLYTNSPKAAESKRRVNEVWRRNNPEKVRASNRTQKLRLNYNLTPEEYSAMHGKQNGACLLCERIDLPLAVDHCHDTGRVRGLLCLPCNGSLGWVERIRRKQDTPWFSAALKYLEELKCH